MRVIISSISTNKMIPSGEGKADAAVILLFDY